MSLTVPEIYRHDRFLARRKVFRLLGAGFTLETDDGTILARSEQKAFRLREDIRVTDQEGAEILHIKADRIIDFGAAYKVVDPRNGEVLGSLRRKGWTSLFRDSWEILDANGIVRGRVVEDSGWKAMVRRAIEMATFFLPQAYHIEVAGQVVGTMTQNYNFLAPKFAVDLSHDTGGLLPRPLALATVILLLAVEGRQAGAPG